MLHIWRGCPTTPRARPSLAPALLLLRDMASLAATRQHTRRRVQRPPPSYSRWTIGAWCPHFEIELGIGSELAEQIFVRKEKKDFCCKRNGGTAGHGTSDTDRFTSSISGSIHPVTLLLRNRTSTRPEYIWQTEGGRKVNTQKRREVSPDIHLRLMHVTCHYSKLQSNNMLR
jgi:hypothetical protein